MNEEYLYYFQLWQIFLGLVFVFISSSLLGYQWGHLMSHKHQQVKESTFIPTTVLGLLALLLGFTFSMAVSRYEYRQSLVLKEANAIGTLYSQSNTIPKKYRIKIQEALKKYVPLRIQHSAAGIDLQKLSFIEQQTQNIHRELWKSTSELATNYRDPITSTFINSLIPVVDIYSEQIFAMENRVPEIVFIIILIVTTSGLSSLSFTKGLARKKSRSPAIVLALLFALIISLIMDLDRPRRGLIRVKQNSLIYLNKAIENS